MSGETAHPWVRLCELASCSPDFDVIAGRMTRDEACMWLSKRLVAHQHPTPQADIEAAYDAWPPKSDSKHIGSVRL